jgi:hypothetical protein
MKLITLILLFTSAGASAGTPAFDEYTGHVLANSQYLARMTDIQAQVRTKLGLEATADVDGYLDATGTVTCTRRGKDPATNKLGCLAGTSNITLNYNVNTENESCRFARIDAEVSFDNQDLETDGDKVTTLSVTLLDGSASDPRNCHLP